MPLKLCLKFKPATIAVVYKMDNLSRTMPAKRQDKKYIHEILVEKMTERTDLRQLCEKMCEQESQYLNPQIISKSQVSGHFILF